MLKYYKYYSIRENNDFYEMLYDINRLYKNNIAIKYRKNNQIKQLTYQELLENICNIHNYYNINNIKNKNIGIISENRYEYIPIYLATVFKNVIAPIDKEIANVELYKLIIKFDIKVLYYTNKTKAKLVDVIGKLNITTINIDEEFDTIVSSIANVEETLERFKIIANKDKFSTLAFTSGTTGDLRGVMLSQSNVVSNLSAAHKNNNLKGPFLSILPMNHTYGFNPGVLTALYIGTTICINMDLKHFLKDIKEYDPYYIGTVPLVVEGVYKNILTEIKKRKKEKTFNRMIKLSNFLLKFKIDIRKLLFGSILSKNLNLLVSGGASLDEYYVKKYNEIGIKVLNGYGLTECSPLVSVNRDICNVLGSVGTIIDRVSVKISEDNEILVKGPNVMLGYYKDKLATKKAMIGGYYKTGDLGYKVGNTLYINGRKKNLIILSNGKNFSPEELESKLLQLPYIKESLVYLNKHAKILAKVYIEANEFINKEQLDNDIKKINTDLPYYKRIDEYIVVDEEFAKTSTKKILRSNYVK